MLLSAVCLLLIYGCGVKEKPAPYPPVTQTFFEPYYPEENMTLGPGDELTVKFYFHPELNDQVIVRPDGKISLAFHQGIDVKGLTPEQLQNNLIKMYSAVFINPVVVVQVERRTPHTVFVTGEVQQGGIKALNTDKTIGQVLAESGVNFNNAALESVILIRRHTKKEYKVYEIDAQPARGKERDIYLNPGDIVFVPKNNITILGDFVQKYIRDIIPPQMTLGFGVTYELNR